MGNVHYNSSTKTQHFVSFALSLHKVQCNTYKLQYWLQEKRHHSVK